MTVAESLGQKLRDALSPSRLDIHNESDRHVGHAGHDGSGESHFRITVVAERFVGQSRLQRQRLVYDALAEELAGPIHALSLRTLTPQEAASEDAAP